MSETHAGESDLFAELLRKLHEQHLLELRMLRGENAQLRVQVRNLQAAGGPSLGPDEGHTVTAPGGLVNGSACFAEAGFCVARLLHYLVPHSVQHQLESTCAAPVPGWAVESRAEDPSNLDSGGVSFVDVQRYLEAAHGSSVSGGADEGRAEAALLRAVADTGGVSLTEAGPAGQKDSPSSSTVCALQAPPACMKDGGTQQLQRRGSEHSVDSLPSTQQQPSLAEAISLFDSQPEQTSASGSVLSRVERMIQRAWFEALFGGLIFANALVMAAEAQYHGLILGTELEHTSVKGINAATLWPSAPAVFDAFDWLFGIAFLAELVLKLVAKRLRFLYGVWNWIDSAIVALWLFSVLGANMPVDPNIIRLARLAKLLRLLRLVHTIQSFDSLYLISTSLASSISILAWASALFLLCQAALALLLSSVLAEMYFKENRGPLENQQTVYTCFGTFTRALFSMFEITLGNWPPMSRMLSENVSEWFMLFGVVHKLTLGFAFVGVVNGVLTQETFKVAATDDKVMVRQKQRMVDTHTKKMGWLFDKAARGKAKAVDLDRFKEVASHPVVSMWLASMELDEKDYELVFSLIDDGDGELTLPELVKGVAKLKGAARSIDLVRVMRYVEDIRAMLEAAGNSAPHKSP